MKYYKHEDNIINLEAFDIIFGASISNYAGGSYYMIKFKSTNSTLNIDLWYNTKEERDSELEKIYEILKS